MPMPNSEKQRRSQNTDSIRVLHVDDDSALLEIAKEILETDTQLEVHSALSAEQALKKIRQEEFDVIVSDYQMPEKDGLEFLKELRTQGNTTPFIIFTGKGREEIVIQALNAGATYYLNKQGSPETVYGELTHAIVNASKAGKAENALKESEAKYRELINGMNDTVWVIDFEGNFIDVNDTSLRVLGYSKDELLSLGIRGIDKHLRPELIQEMINQLPVVGTQVFETVHTTKAGQEIPVEISSSLVTYQGKQSILSIARNITKRKKAEQMLRENEERLRLKLDSVLSPDVDIEEQELSNIIDAPKLQVMMDDLYAVTKMVFALLDLKGNVLVKTGWKDICTKFHRVNPQTCKNCLESDLELSKGVKQGEYRLYKCKNNMWDIVTPLIMNGKHIGNIYSGQFFFEDEKINRDIFAAQAEKYGFNKEEYLAAFDRVPRYSREKIQKFMLFNTKLSEMISKLSYSNLKIAKALSDQKTTERTIRANEQRWATTLSSIGDAVIATDEKGNITFMNNAAEHLTGWNLVEASQKPLKQVFCIVNEETRESVENPVDRVLKEGIVVGLANHTVLLCKDGKEVPIADSGAPIRDEKGNIMGVVLVFRDITERKQVEEQIRTSEKHLRSTLDNMLEGCQILDSEWRYVYLNEVAAIQGRSTKEMLLGKTIMEMYPQIEKTKLFSELQRCMNDRVPIRMENEFIFPDGVNGWFELNIEPVPQGIFILSIDISDRKKAEESMKASEARYRSLYGAVSGGIVVQDQNGAIVDANAVACELLGLTHDQMQGRTSIDPRWHTIHEDGSPFPGEEHPAMITLRTGKPLRNVVMGVFHPKDNVHRWIQINSEPIIDPQDGKVKFVMTTFLDITKRKKLEEELLAKEEKYHSLFSSMNEGVCLHQVIYDQAGKPLDYIILDANPAYEVITGIKREDALGKQASELYGSGEAPYLQIYAKVAETGEPISIGTYFPPLKKYFTISVFSPAKGKFATIFTDTTEQKAQSENLKESKKTFELLFSKNPEAIVLVDKDMHIKEANEAFIQLFGYSQTEIAEANLPDLVVPDNLKHESEELQKNAKQGVVKVETVRKHKDGTEIPVTLSIETIMEQNRFAGFIVVYKDISDIAKTKRTLEKALYETQVLNEKLSVVGSLTRHDVRNKLHGIVGLTYLLEKKLNENSEAPNFIKKINMFVEQTVRILDFSSAYERIGLEQLKMINAEETFNEACALFSEECKSKTSIELKGLYVFADSLLQKVFYNLIDNSLKHGKTVTTINAYYKEEPNNIKLIYEDNGTGISEADKAKLFTEQFAKGKGAGHGLFMIQKLMDVYGWTIQETGTPDKGAQFTITIPKKTKKNCDGYKIQ